MRKITLHLWLLVNIYYWIITGIVFPLKPKNRRERPQRFSKTCFRFFITFLKVATGRNCAVSKLFRWLTNVFYLLIAAKTEQTVRRKLVDVSLIGHPCHAIIRARRYFVYKRRKNLFKLSSFILFKDVSELFLRILQREGSTPSQRGWMNKKCLQRGIKESWLEKSVIKKLKR